MRYGWMMVLICVATLVVAQDAPKTASKTSPLEMAIYYLQNADVSQAAELVENLIPEEMRKRGPRLLPEPRINALYVQGDADFQAWVEAFLERYDKDAESRRLVQVPEPTTQMMPLDNVDPSEALVVIESLGLVGKEVSAAVSPGKPLLIVRGQKEAVERVTRLLEQIDAPASSKSSTPSGNADENTVIVTLRADGQVLMQGSALQAGDFDKSVGKETTVVLEVDPDVHHSKVVALIEQLKKKGVTRLSLKAKGVPKHTTKSPAWKAVGTPTVAASTQVREPLHEAYVSAERAAAETAAQWREEKSGRPVDSGKLQSLAEQLRKEVQAAFRLRQQWQQVQLDRSRAELDRLSARVNRREQIADQIIEHRIRELQTGQDLSWLPAASQTRSVSSEESSQPNPASARMNPAAAKSTPPATGVGLGTSSSANSVICTLSNGGRRLTITARSQQRADEIATLLDEYFPDDSRRQSSGMEFVIDDRKENLDQIIRYVMDLDVRRKLRKEIEAATQVPVKLFAAASSGVSWALNDVNYDLPAKFKLDSGQRLLLEIEDVSALRNRSMFASIEISKLSEDAVDFFASHSLNVALSIPDFVSASEGRETTKRYYLEQTRSGDWRINVVSTADARGLSRQAGELVATVTVGNIQPQLTGDIVRTRSFSRGARKKYETSDSVLFVEMIVSPKDDSVDAPPRRAIYMDGVVVGDDGLIAVVTDEIADKSGELKVDVESITLKTANGQAIYDAQIVATDPVSGLALLQSSVVPVPALRLDGPAVVDAQGLRMLGRTIQSIDGRVFKESGWTHDTKVLETDGYEPKHPGRFLVSGNGFDIPGSAVTLSTTGQLVGIYTGAPTRERPAEFDGDAKDVIAVSVVDELIRRFRQQ